jgi:Fe(3+) dicitrate transport protein
MHRIFNFNLLYFLYFLFCVSILKAQSGSIEGTVIDTAGRPLQYAIVGLTQTKLSGTTDINGHFQIQNIPAGKYTLSVILLGYLTNTFTVEITENETKKSGNIILQLNPDKIICVNINGMSEMNGVKRLPDNLDGIIYSGQKNIVLVIDSMNSNTAQSSTREELGRVPGANIAEAQYNGFPYNGIGLRGFNGMQSSNMDIRQNGYNITADVYGHPETYYSPPSEAVKEIDVISGESSLEFGPQFGGVVNYVLKDAPPDKPIEYTASLTGGSFGMFNCFNSVGGTLGKWSYFAWAQYQGAEGWRPNSVTEMAVGYAKLQYNASANFSISAEYSIQRNLIQMAGGLDDNEFARNPDTSTRPRNWMENPANFATITAKWKITGKMELVVQSVFNNSQRDLVWRNDDINIGLPDSINPKTNAYTPREVEHWEADNSTTEIRLLSNYTIGHNNQTFATGLRLYGGYFNDDDRGPGTTGSGFDMSLVGPGQTYGRVVWIHDYDIAPYIENTFRIGKLSLTPGFRYEYLTSSVTGYFTNWDSMGTVPSLQVPVSGAFTRYIPLGGVAAQYATSASTNIYGNFAQAYNPLNYEDLYPGGVQEIIDPNLHDVHGYNGDLGFRGTVKSFLNFDIGGFYTLYQGAIATEVINSLGNTEETNIGNAVHEGIESYIDWNIIKTFTNNSLIGYIDIFNSFSYDNAKYISGPYSGNRVEDAPQYISRTGFIYTLKNFSFTLFWDYTSQQFTDANNTINNTAYLSQNAEVGLIPSYRIFDLSASLKIKNYILKAGIDNLANASYFTMRVVEYPGPGIIPSVGRSGYIGFSATF